MEIVKESKITISLVGDNAKDFASAIDKISKGDTKIGYSKSDLTDGEIRVIKDLSKKL